MNLNPFRKKKIRTGLKFVDYSEGDKLVKQGWTIAKEEDRNNIIGMVYLELLQDKPTQPLTNLFNNK
jgi:hypothetical protein